MRTVLNTKKKKDFRALWPHSMTNPHSMRRRLSRLSWGLRPGLVLFNRRQVSAGSRSNKRSEKGRVVRPMAALEKRNAHWIVRGKCGCRRGSETRHRSTARSKSFSHRERVPSFFCAYFYRVSTIPTVQQVSSRSVTKGLPSFTEFFFFAVSVTVTQLLSFIEFFCAYFYRVSIIPTVQQVSSRSVTKGLPSFTEFCFS